MTVQDLRHPPGKYRLTIDDYALLDGAGAFGNARTELIEGNVILMSPQYRPHGMLKLALYDALRDALRPSVSPLTAVVEFSLALDDHSMPEPDIMLTSAPSGDGPVPLASVALVIEVADATLDTDLGTKARLYAAAGVPEYWVADLNARLIHQMWNPKDGNYADTKTARFADSVAVATIAGLVIDTDRL